MVIIQLGVSAYHPQLDDAERTCNEVLSFMSQKHEIFYRLLQEQQPSSLSSQVSQFSV